MPCLLCGSGRFSPVVAAEDPVTRAGGFCLVVCCQSCGLQFTNPRPVAAEMGGFYPSDYRPWADRAAGSRLRAGVRHRLERAVLRVAYAHPPQPAGGVERLLALAGRAWLRRPRQRETWFPFRPPGRLLDFGCGRGDFLELMRFYGWTVEGVELSRETAAAVEQRTGIRVHVGSLPNADLEPQSFDAVTMWNSLEHVHHPRAIVRAARDLVRTGGLVVIGVPNIDSWSFRQFREHWWQLDLPRHLTHFTPATLADLVEREGFAVRTIDQIGRPGWLRKSVRRATAAGAARWSTRLLGWKWAALAASNWGERTRQADFIRAIAEKR
ncbi:MAG TPA: class I SAM-dependent methyltransferase [Planctomycetaceae bacterium]|nr:class I SAM-dependent methyltransferase [Planctomycetaceae bacterium]